MLRERWRYYGIALLVLSVYVWAAERQLHLAALPHDPRLSLISYPARIDGRVAVSPAELAFLAQGYRVGDSMTIAGEGIAFTLTAVRATSTFYLIVAWVNGLFFWIVAVLVFAPRMDRVPGRDLYWASLLYGLAIMVGDVYFPNASVSTSAVHSSLRILALALLPTLLLHLGLNFPQRRNILDRHPRLMPGIFTAAIVLTSVHATALVLYFSRPVPLRWQWLRATDLTGKLFLVAVFTAGCASFFYTQQKAEQAREKEQAKWILWGITIGAAPFIFLRTLPALFGASHVLPLEVARLFSIVIPVAFSFTVVRYKFLDIDIIIRRSLIYPLLAGVMAGIYLILGVAVGRSIERSHPDLTEFITIVATLVPVALFPATHRFIARWVDRTFFKIRYSYGQALASYQTRIAAARTQMQLAWELRRFLETHLDPKRVAVVVRYRTQVFASGDQPAGLVDGLFTSLRPFLRGDAPVAASDSTSQRELERWDLPVKYVEAGFQVFQPLVVEHKLLGLAMLAEKQSERRYIEQDLDLLTAAAGVTAASLERMNLAQEVVEESVARTRSDEMNRYKTEFFSRVAHDLRSPLTSISWSARNLLDGVVGPLSDEHASYLSGIEASANQLVRLVNNLLEMTRLESSSLEIELGPVDLADVVHETVRRLRPVADAKPVRLEARTQPDLPAIEGNREKLLEVADNLVENAVRYAPPRSSVEIDLSAPGSDRQALTVRDHGPGVDPEEQSVIFEAFQQGKPSPHSSQLGFGLGLHVVKIYVELMHGTVSVTNHPEGGAVFTCVFSHRPSSEDSA